MTTVRQFFARLFRRDSDTRPRATASHLAESHRTGSHPTESHRPGPQPADEVEPPQWLIVGLGNPGPRYAATRHNVGQIVLDHLADEHTSESSGPADGSNEPTAGFSDLSDLGSASSNSQAAPLAIAGHRVLLVKPTTFMNLSGEAVDPLARRWQVPPDHIIVIHDELDLPVGKVRLRLGGSENGHNGLKSVSEHLGTRDYLRVRVGISRPPRGTSIPDYVLSPLEDDAPTTRGVETAAQAVELLVSQGLARAQNVIHQK